MKKTLSIILVIVMLMALVPAAFAGDPIETATTVSVDPSSVSQGTSVTVTISVSAGGSTPATGSLVASCNGVSITLTPGLSGVTGTIDTTSMEAKEYDIVANYTGDSNYKNSSGTAKFTVTEATKFTVTYANGGHGTAPDPVTNIISGSTITLATMADVEGFRFAGWNDGTNDYAGGATYTVTGNVTMTARWTPVYAITVDSVTGGSVTADKSVAAKDEIVTLTATPSTGYHLKSLTADTATIADNKFTMPEAAVKVTPEFALNTYTVKFHANGGTGEDKTQTFTYNEAKALDANTYTRTGYTFLGWSTNSAATAANYGDKESVSNLTSTDGGVVDLYAIWTPNTTTYNVTVGKYSGANLGRAYYSFDQKTWYEVTTTTGTSFATAAGSTVYFKMDPYQGYYRHPYVVNANGSYYSPGYGQIFSVVINENKTVKLNFSQYVPTGDAGVWGYVVTMLASAGTAAGVYFGTKKKK